MSRNDRKVGRGRKNGSIRSTTQKGLARPTIDGFEDYDSESDNLNNARGNYQTNCSRSKRKPYIPFAASRPGLPPESSSASSSAEEDVQGNSIFHREAITSPRARSFPRGGKFKPSPGQADQDLRTPGPDIDMDSDQDNPAPKSPFMDATPARNTQEESGRLDLAMNEVPCSESVGNLLGISRNSSGILLGTEQAHQANEFAPLV